eukprot:TRINITY_DN3_c0_g1_i24.p1 TRINITY_DN3_c0_g1~~TRINITY_DN3_c0_g1_i24.p1  ORF type:complete len:100 (-),score=2.66 TRINITY_DN3_c0_g1_i24:530-829(-)
MAMQQDKPGRKQARFAQPNKLRANRHAGQQQAPKPAHKNTKVLGPGYISARNPTTSFLTATTLIYTHGAGITAAAGTRLALHWVLVKRFKLYSFQLPHS